MRAVHREPANEFSGSEEWFRRTGQGD